MVINWCRIRNFNSCRFDYVVAITIVGPPYFVCTNFMRVPLIVYDFPFLKL